MTIAEASPVRSFRVRWLPGLTASCALMAGLHAGSARANSSCSFAELINGICPTITQEDLQFSAFTLAGSGTPMDDRVQIQQSHGVYNISFLSGNDRGVTRDAELSFTISAINGRTLKDGRADASTSAGKPFRFVFASTALADPGILDTSGDSVTYLRFTGSPASAAFSLSWNMTTNATAPAVELYLQLNDADPASVPGPIPLFGGAIAFAFSRRLRHRIKATE
jgi:hypothetical protein